MSANPPDHDDLLLEPLPYAAPASPPDRVEGLLGSPVERMATPGGSVPHPAGDAAVTVRDIDPYLRERDRPQVVFVTPNAEEGQRIREAVREEDLRRIADLVSELYGRVGDEIAGSREASAQALSWLNEARTVLMARPEHFPLAELRAQQARVLLQGARESRDAAKKDQGRIIGWNLLWLVLFGALFAVDGVFASALVGRRLAVPPPGLAAGALPSLTWYFQPWLCLLMGGIGGALAALIVLGREVRRREYNAEALVDYRLNALKGAILGALTYYLLLGGFITAAATTTIGTDAADFAQRVQIASSPLFILVAFIAGFAQQRLLALLPGVWGTVTGEERDAGVIEAAPIAVPVAAVPAAPPALTGGAFPGEGASVYDSEEPPPTPAA